jgi:hypothetical protein
MFGQEKAAPYFQYSCPKANPHQLRREIQLVFLVHPYEEAYRDGG